ncbi:MAG: metallophosphoesterase [Pseudonocardiaceae bacterium]
MSTSTRASRTALWLSVGVVAAAAAGAYYATAIEPRAWRVRRLDVPLLVPDSEPFRVLHISDIHMLPRQHKKQDWLRGLVALDPDFVALTGDNLASPEAVASVIDALSPLRERPGAFVLGNSDYYGPTPKTPWNYTHRGRSNRIGVGMPTSQLCTALKSLGWSELTHQRVVLDAGGRRVELAGVDDASLNRANYETIAGKVDESADLHIGLTHTPEPELVSRFAEDGFELVLAGHTHGGQVRIPKYGAVVTNCGIYRKQARGLHRWRDRTFLHVSAGVGTSPYAPVRFGCPPEAIMLTLVSDPQLR